MEKKNMKRSFFITIEGLEGSGKTSIINFLKKIIKKKGYSFKIYREPGSTPVGEKIRDILLDKKNKKLSFHTELLLYLAARTQLIEEKLKKDLTHYDFVICDRFFDSTLVYQGIGLGLGKVAKSAVEIFSLGISPNLTLLIDSPAKRALARIKNKDRIESRPLSFHNKLRDGYLKLAKKYPRRIKVIDGRGSIESIFKQAEQILDKSVFSKK